MVAKIAAIITALEETGGSPESTLYIYLDMNMDLWDRIRTLLVASRLITVKGNYVTLTDEGKAMARKLNEAIGR